MKKVIVIGILSLSMIINACGSEKNTVEDTTSATDVSNESTSENVETEASDEEGSSEAIAQQTDVTDIPSEESTTEEDVTDSPAGRTVKTTMKNQLILRTWDGESTTEAELSSPIGDSKFSSEVVRGRDLQGDGKYKITSIDGNGFWLVTPFSDEISPATAEAIYIIGKGTDDDEFNNEMEDASDGIEVELNDEHVITIYNIDKGLPVRINFEALDVVDPEAEWNEKVNKAIEDGPEKMEYPEDVKTENIIIESHSTATPMHIVFGKINEEEITWYCDSEVGNLAGNVISQHGWVECKGTWGVSPEGHYILKKIEPLN